MVQASNRQDTGRQLADFSPSFQCVVRNYFDFSCLEYAWLGHYRPRPEIMSLARPSKFTECHRALRLQRFGRFLSYRYQIPRGQSELAAQIANAIAGGGRCVCEEF